MTEAPDTLAERLGRLETSQVSDILDEMGLTNQVFAPLAVRLGARTVAGRAGCVAGEPVVRGRAAPPALPADILEQTAGAGRILVMAAAGYTAGSCMGGLIAASLLRRGCRGVITDGSVRDGDEIAGLGLPLFAAAVSPVNSARRWRLVRAGALVLMPGMVGQPVAVAPDDLILADGDGVLSVPANAAEEVIAHAEALAAIEGRIRGAMAAGLSRPEAFAAHPRFDHVTRADRVSKVT